MKIPPSQIVSTRSLWAVRGILFLCLALLAYRVLLPARIQHLWIDFLFLFLVFGYIVLTAAGIGRMILRRFELVFSRLEFNILSVLLGLAFLSISIAAFGMVGWLTKAGLFGCLAICGFISSFEWPTLFQKVVSSARSIRLPKTGSVYEAVLLIFVIGLFPLLIVNTLTPPWDYDALLYHLEVPRQFLAEGRIAFHPEIFESAYPFLGEMLFVVGIVAQAESLAKLINLTYAILFILSTYSFAVRFFNREVALTAAGIMVSTPIIVVWATWVSIDYAWAAFEFWALYAICLWLAGQKQDARKWLTLSGVLSGLAASTKYISLPVLLIVVILLFWKSMQGSKQPFAAAARNLWTFGASAGLVMSLWYIKNWIWTGNPIYPLLFGGAGWDPLKNQLFTQEYMNTFGMGRNLLDFFLLPYNVYAHGDRFAALPWEFIHPLLWLAFLFPFLKKSKEQSIVSIYVFLYYIWWFLGSQLIRFLLPVSAFLAILAGAVLDRFPLLLRNTFRLTLIVGLAVFSFVYQLTVLQNSGTFSYVMGWVSADEILQTFVDDYRVKQFIQRSLSEQERALFLWDGRGYYCDSRCRPDHTQSLAVRLTLQSPDPQQLADDLQADGITHLMLSSTDAYWFIQYHDPNGNHRRAMEYYREQFLPVCGKSVYKDNGMELFEITCN